MPSALPLGRDSIAWRVNSEPVVFAGGGRALLLQVAHPAVGAGVEQYSSYAADPWGRLLRTIDTMMKLSFGSPEVSERQQRLLQKMHRRVNGETDDGTPYRALDPALLLWVWATLADTSLLMFERTFGRLSDTERDQYYRESLLVAQGCGVPEEQCPEDLAAFHAYVQRVVVEDLRVTDAARKVAVASTHIPLPGLAGRVVEGPTALVTVGMLPPTIREQFGYRWSALQQRRLDAFFLSARAAGTVTPASLRRILAEATVRQKRPPRVDWLRRRGAELTAEHLSSAGYGG